MPGSASVVIGLYRSCHPLPSAAVTVTAVLLTATAGNSAGTCVLAAIAVMAGQLTVGWSNDRIDVHRDRRVEHEGKPLAAGQVPLPLVDAALTAAVVVTVVFSLLMGWRPGVLHLLAVAAAWLYNLGVKATWLSWLPYAAAFGAMPAFATLALPGHPWPHAWVVLAAGLLGAAVNFTNAKQSLARHPRSDVHGLPDRLGGRASLLVAAALVAGSSALITWAPAGSPSGWALAATGLTAVLVVAGVPALWRHADTRVPFYWLMLAAPVQILALVVTARPYH